MRIIAYTKKGRIRERPANFMSRCRNRVKATQAFIDVIESLPMDPEAVSKALTEHKWTEETFKPYSKLKNGYSLIAVDPYGNEHIICIKEVGE